MSVYSDKAARVVQEGVVQEGVGEDGPWTGWEEDEERRCRRKARQGGGEVVGHQVREPHCEDTQPEIGRNLVDRRVLQL